MDALSAVMWFCVVVVGAVAGATAGWAQAAPSRELDIVPPVSLKYRIDRAPLPAAENDRLIKQCTAKATPCVVTVTGTEIGVKADSIKFYN